MATLAFRIALGALTLSTLAAAQELLDSPLRSLTPSLTSFGTTATPLDINGDGHLDLIARTGSNGITVFYGDGTGALTEFDTLSVPNSPRFALADIDGDNTLDMVVVAFTGGIEISTFTGAGDGGFTLSSSATITQPGQFAGFVVGDFDSSGSLDIAVAQDDQARTSFFFGAGDGTFGPLVNQLGLSPGALVAALDLNGDGHLDLVFFETLSDRIVVEHGDGTGSFGPTTVLFDDIYAPELIDSVTGNGTVDFVLEDINFNISVVTWTAGVGVTATTPLSDDVSSVDAAVDVDGDGLLDLVCRPPGSNAVLFELQQADATFAATGRFAHGDGFPIVADFNEDGHAESLSISGVAGGELLVADGFDDGMLTDTASMGFGGASNPTVADIDGDGALDIVAGRFNSVALLRGTDRGQFLPHPEFPLGTSLSIRRLQLADVNADNVLDLVGLAVPSILGLFISLGVGDGTFQPATNTFTSGNGTDMDLGDIDGDGDTDVATLTTGVVTLFTNDGTGTFTESASWAVDPVADSLRLADLDDDGFLDVTVLTVATDTLDSFIETYLHTALGTWISSTVLPTRFAFPGPVGLLMPPAFLVDDLDGDGFIDLVHGDDQALVIRYGLGNDTYEPVVTFATTLDPLTITRGDINGDGLADLVLTERDLVGLPYHVSVLLATGPRSYALETEVSIASSTDAAQLADIDLDGAVDVVVNTGGNVWILRNTTGPWKELGASLPGSAGFSALRGYGSLVADTPVTIDLLRAPPSSSVFLVTGFSALFANVAGGTLVPSLDIVFDVAATDAEGDLTLAGLWPAGIPSDTTIWFQAWVPDAGAPKGWSASQGLSATTP